MRTSSSFHPYSSTLRREVTGGQARRIFMRTPCARLHRLNRHPKSASSPANISWLNPPRARKTSPRQKMKQPGVNFSQSACAHVRVGIKKQKPVAGRGARARVSRAGNLVDGFKNDMSSSVARELRGPIGRVVVHHDGFGLEVRTRVGAQGDGETPHATFDVFGFVECRDDDG